jgi:hypothetical protein
MIPTQVLRDLFLDLLPDSVTQQQKAALLTLLGRVFYVLITFIVLVLGFFGCITFGHILAAICAKESPLGNLEGVSHLAAIIGNAGQAIGTLVALLAFSLTLAALLITAKQLGIAARQLDELRRQSRITSLNLDLSTLRAKMETLRRGHAIPFPEQEFDDDLWSKVEQSFINDVPTEYQELATKLSTRYKDLLKRREKEEATTTAPSESASPPSATPPSP